MAPYWPMSTSSKGHALITTRNHLLAFKPATDGVEITSWDVQTGSQFLLYLLKESIGEDLKAETTSALALSERLSGHALAISHMAGMIFEGSMSVQEFLIMYIKNPGRFHARDELTALWDLSFRSLTPQSQALLGVLSFLMPDLVPLELFEEADDDDMVPFPDGLAFCSDEFE